MQGSSKSSKSTSCALAGKTARACESCLKRRARWYCASDDAFLCHVCDTSVHLANKLASRHERVRLETGSLKHTRTQTQTTPSIPNPNFHSTLSPSTLPPWQGGFTRKPRTPRYGKKSSNYNNQRNNNNNNNNPVVPEFGSDNEGEVSKEDDQLIFSVPVLDPFEINGSEVDHHQNEFCGSFGGLDFEAEFGISLIGFDDKLGRDNDDDDDDENKWGGVPGFLPSDAELAEFAADVETLLTDGDEEGRMRGMLPLLDDHKVEMNLYDDDDECCYGMKVEDESVVSSCWGLDFDMKCADDKAAVAEAVVEEKPGRLPVEGGGIGVDHKRKIFLRLNYDGVIDEWGSQGLPWTSGRRPELNAVDGWPNCTGGVGPSGVENEMGEEGHVVGGDGGREARVMRYREKRKSRLFSKKIRYEVRKLNAEKRPRLKGRFVKRTTPNNNISSSSSSTKIPIGVHRTFPYLKV